MRSYSVTHADMTRETCTDHGDGTGLIEWFDADGVLTHSEEVEGFPIPVAQSLDSVGALATLLVVEGVLTLHDASSAIHETEQALIDEAEAWSLG